VGVYFEQVGGAQKLKAGKLAENTSSRLIGVFPAGPTGNYKVVIKTQFTGSGKFSKDLRVIESGFVLTK
jgi:hypothetical protein